MTRAAPRRCARPEGARSTATSSAASFLNHLEPWFATARDREWDTVLAAWRARDGLRGHRVEIRGTGPAWQGRAEGIDADGYLEIATDAGVRQRIISGEIASC